MLPGTMLPFPVVVVLKEAILHTVSILIRVHVFVISLYIIIYNKKTKNSNVLA